MTSNKGHWLLAGVMLCFGLLITGVGARLIPVDPESVHAPYWVIVLCGVVFLAGGIGALVGERSPLSRFLAATIAVSLGVAFAWVAFYGDGQHMSGGFWFLPHSANVTIGRVVFGLGSLRGIAIGAAALFGKVTKRGS